MAQRWVDYFGVRSHNHWPGVERHTDFDALASSSNLWRHLRTRWLLSFQSTCSNIHSALVAALALLAYLLANHINCDCDCSSVRVLPGMKQPGAVTTTTTSASELLSSVQRPLSVMSATTTSADRVTRPSSVIPAVADSALLTSVPTAVSTTADTADKPPSTKSTDIADTAIDTAPQEVAVTSSTTSVGGTSSILAQLSYAQPSIELLRRRRAADTVDTLTVSSTATTSAPAHLLSSSTQAALAALASTPRRSVNNNYCTSKLYRFIKNTTFIC